MSDSLALPWTRLRARRRRPPRPPNWKLLLLVAAWDCAILVAAILCLGLYHSPWAPFTGGGALLDIIGIARCWRAGGSVMAHPYKGEVLALALTGVVVGWTAALT